MPRPKQTNSRGLEIANGLRVPLKRLDNEVIFGWLRWFNLARRGHADALPPSALFRENCRSGQLFAGSADHSRRAAGTEPADRRIGSLARRFASEGKRAWGAADAGGPAALRRSLVDPAQAGKPAGRGPLQ